MLTVLETNVAEIETKVVKEHYNDVPYYTLR